MTTLSCEDGNKNYTEEFDSVYYYLKEGVNEFDFYSVNSAKVQTITVGRGGMESALSIWFLLLRLKWTSIMQL